MENVAAIERCTYCREYVPVTCVPVRPMAEKLHAELPICEGCRGDGR